MYRDRFNDIYIQYNQAVFKVAMTTLYDSKAAEDVTQDTFLSLYLYGLERFNGNQNVKYWLIKAAKNRAIDFLRRNRRSIPVDADFFDKIEIEENPYMEVEKEYIIETLIKGIKLLPEIYKIIVILHYFNQMTQSAIAKTLQIPHGTVKSRINRARKLLKLYIVNEERRALQKGSLPVCKNRVKTVSSDY